SWALGALLVLSGSRVPFSWTERASSGRFRPRLRVRRRLGEGPAPSCELLLEGETWLFAGGLAFGLVSAALSGDLVSVFGVRRNNRNGKGGICPLITANLFAAAGGRLLHAPELRMAP
ncbi:MAG TPA: hypothetical protein DGL25_04420, partial [Dehalococcoidia bacterium]|nr:hypothetical protein [Dehalococcoidia bacterium]